MTEQPSNLDIGQSERERVCGQRVPEVVQADRLLVVTDEARVFGRNLECTKRVPSTGRVALRRLEDERVRTERWSYLRA
jgi:hypothetical protein